MEGQSLRIETVKDVITGTFVEIGSSGELLYYNGLEIKRDRKQWTTNLHQEKYIRDTLKKFKMTGYKIAPLTVEGGGLR